MTPFTTTRRKFCALGGGALIRLISSQAVAFEPSKLDLAAIDRKRILRAANRYLHEKPITITAYSSSRNAGGKHDYFSEADYWWPDPRNPSGPYIQRDGLSNPANFVAHRHALIRLSLQVPALTAAWIITRKKNYADHAGDHLRAWFLNPKTRMNPNLQYAQAIHGRTTGRGIGIIDTIHLVEVVRATTLLKQSGSFSHGEIEGLQQWFAEYLEWMTTSNHGKEERDTKNNHGTCWVMQVAEFARFTADHGLTVYCRDRFKNVLLPNQIAEDGSFPLELRRTKPYSYCIFNLDAMATICQILSTENENLRNYTLGNGGGLKKAIAFMFPYLADKSAWPYPKDVEYFEDFPVRQPSLLFAGLAYSRSDYLALWRNLNPDPTVQEVIRNYPIRQPILWIA